MTLLLTPTKRALLALIQLVITFLLSDENAHWTQVSRGILVDTYLGH